MIERVEYKPGFGILVKEVTAPLASVLFYHGGGWASGEAELLVPYWDALPANLLCASAEHRVFLRHRSTVYDSIDDAEESAAFFSRRFPDLPLFLAGASSGGLLALFASRRVATAGLVLFNPVLDLSSQGFRSRATPPGGDEKISPLHVVRSGEKFPPILLIQGENDKVTPASTAREFADAVASDHGSIRLECYGGRQHGFFKVGTDAPSTAALVQQFILDIVARR